MADAPKTQGNAEGAVDSPSKVVVADRGDEPDEIEGGEVGVTGTDGDPALDGTVFPFDPAKQKADTARNIAYALVAILGVSVLLHYLVISLTSLPPQSELRLEAYKSAFNAWLPVASGLVSAAVTYYFTRDRDDKK